MTQAQTQRASKASAAATLTKNKVDHAFRLEFDRSTGIPATWVDTKTLNFMNTLRENIFASSSHHDMQHLAAIRAEAKAKVARQNAPKQSTVNTSKSKTRSGSQPAGKAVSKSPEKVRAREKEKDKIVVGRDQYDYCHHCKQLKNVELLIRCKYSSPSCNQFVPYPYEPQCYTVNGCKIFNTDT